MNAIRLIKLIISLCHKAFNKPFLAFFYIRDGHKTQETCDRNISDDPFSLKYVPDQYKTQQMCDDCCCVMCDDV